MARTAIAFVLFYSYVSALDLGSQLYGFGGNSAGQLGLFDWDDRPKPTQIEIAAPDGTSEVTIIQLAVCRQHTLIVTNHGLYAMGTNQHGEMGLGFLTPDYDHPKRVEFFTPEQTIHSVSGGEYHSLVWANDKVFSFGFGHYGALGLGTKQAQYGPKEITFFSDKRIQLVQATKLTSLVLADDKLYIFGANYGGNLGLGEEYPLYQLSPVEMEFFSDKHITAVSKGADSHTFVMADGKLYGWGQNGNGELGVGDVFTRFTPVEIEWTAPHPIDEIHVGGQRTIIRAGNSLYSMGANDYGQAGIDRFGEVIANPTECHMFRDLDIQDVQMGTHHTVLLTRDNLVYLVGNNSNGQLGVGDFEPRLKPAKLNLSSLQGSVTAIRAAGMQTFLIVAKDSSVDSFAL